MVETFVEIWRQRIFAGVATRAVSAVVSDRHRLSQWNIEAERLGNGPCDLGDFESVSQAGSLMIIWEDEDLSLASEAPEG
jgi:hypothetical protein